MLFFVENIFIGCYQKHPRHVNQRERERESHHRHLVGDNPAKSPLGTSVSKNNIRNEPVNQDEAHSDPNKK